MLKDIKNTVKQSAIYGLSRISLKLVSLVLFPVYSVYFSVAEYGIIVRAELFWQIISSFLLFAFEQALLRWLSNFKDENEKKTLTFNIFLIIILFNSFFLIIGIFFAERISILLFESGNFSRLVLICFGISLAESLMMIPLLLLRYKEQAVKYVGVVVSSTVISLLLQLYVIYFTDYRITGIFVSKLIAPLIVFIFLSYTLFGNLKFDVNTKLIKEIFVFSIPLMFASLISMMLNSQDRFILGILTNSTEVGLYGLGYNIAGVLNFFFIAPFAIAFQVIFWKKVKDENAGRFFTKCLTYSQFSLTWAAIILSLASVHLIKIFALNPDYWIASSVIPFLGFALVIANFQTIGFMSFYYSNKTSIVFLILFITAVFNFLLNLFMIPVFNMYGAAITAFVSYLFAAILIYKISFNYYFIKWEIFKLISLVITGALLTAPFFLIKFDSALLTIFLKIMAIISFPFILYLLNFYEERELLAIKGFFLKYKRKLL